MTVKRPLGQLGGSGSSLISDLHNPDDIADHVGGALVASETAWHCLFACISEDCAAPVTERTLDRSAAIAFIAFAAEHLIEDIPVISRPSARRAGHLPLTLTVWADTLRHRRSLTCFALGI